MGSPVKLSDVIDAMELQSDESPMYLDKRSGKAVMISADISSYAEGDEAIEGLPDWAQDDVRAAREINEGSEDYLALPDRFDIDEFRMMEDFASDREDGTVRDALLSALGGRGSFGRFKDRCIEHGVDKQWYAYRHAEYKSVAEEWGRDNDVPYVDDETPNETESEPGETG